MAVVDAGSAVASEHSAGGVGFGRSAEHGGPLTATLGVDTDHATTGVEAQRPARHGAGPAQRADATDLDAVGDGSETPESVDQTLGDGTTAVDDATASVAGVAQQSPTQPVDDASDAAPLRGEGQQSAESVGDLVGQVAGSTGSAGDVIAPVADVEQPAESAGDVTAPVADAGQPAGSAGDGTAPVAGLVGHAAGSAGSNGDGSAPVAPVVEDVVAPVAGVVRQLGAPADGGAAAPAAPGAGFAEAAAPIVDVIEQVSAPLRSAAESLPKPGEPLLPGAGGLLPGLGTQPDDETPQVPVVPGNGGTAGQSGGSSVATSIAVAPVAPGMTVLPTEELAIAELAAGPGTSERPVDEMPTQPQPRRGELPATVNVGVVPNTSNGGAGNGPAAQDAEQVGAASERTLLGVARTSDGHALSNDADKPPVSPD